MINIEVITDFNGIVIFEPTRLCEYFGGKIEEGSDLFSKFMSANVGDDVLSQGIVIPLLGIDDAGYSFEFYINEIPIEKQNIIFDNGVFPLKVNSRLVIADLVVLKEWIQDIGWIDINVPPGCYSCYLRGFVERDKNNIITDAGYQVVLNKVDILPVLSGRTDIDCRVLF